MIQGGCLCGAVRYELAGSLGDIHHCHCGMCRKAHGSPFSSFARARSADLRVTAGEDRLRGYRSSPPVERVFCTTCGGKLFFRFDGMPDAVWIAAGSLDGDPAVHATSHMFVASKAPWDEITDGLPQHAEYPPEV